MTKFETDGFLSAEIAEYERDVETFYPKRLEIARNTNRLVHKVIYSANVHNQELVEMLLAALLSRQASTFQGFVILMRKGLLMQAQMLQRNIAETMFIIGAIRKDEAFAKQYVISDEVASKKSLEALIRHQERRGGAADETAKQRVKDLTARIANENLTKLLSAEQIAQKAGLSDYYDTLYRFTSMAVHTSVRGLDKVLEADAEGNVHSLNYGPEVTELGMYFDYASSMMLYSLHEVASYFDLSVAEIEALQTQNAQQAGPADVPVVEVESRPVEKK
jgi:hypothetical protein